jgi:diamine N-acetyltransferase
MFVDFIMPANLCDRRLGERRSAATSAATLEVSMPAFFATPERAITATAMPRVALRPLSPSDVDHVMTWVNDHDVMAYFANRQSNITRDEELAYLTTLVASKNDRAYSIFADDAYVGQCSVNQIYWPARNGRLFVVINKGAQGKSYGPEAVRQLLDVAWNDLGLHKLWLIVRRENRAAQAMYLKLGFDFEGVLTDEYCVAGTYFDMVRMSIIDPSVRPAR